MKKENAPIQGRQDCVAGARNLTAIHDRTQSRKRQTAIWCNGFWCIRASAHHRPMMTLVSCTQLDVSKSYVMLAGL